MTEGVKGLGSCLEVLRDWERERAWLLHVLLVVS